MRILFLDTASNSPSLALCNEQQTLALHSLPKQGESQVIPLLEEALRQAGWRYEDHVNSQGEHVAGLTHIACVVGPGGFVSLRIGVTAANTLAWALSLPSAGIHPSDLWAARASIRPTSVMLSAVSEANSVSKHAGRPPQHDNADFLWLHSTRRTQLFVRGFGAFKERFSGPALVDLEEAASLHGTYVGELIEEHQKVLTGCKPLMEVPSLEAVLPSFLKNLEYRKQQLLPWYGREA